MNDDFIGSIQRAVRDVVATLQPEVTSMGGTLRIERWDPVFAAFHVPDLVAERLSYHPQVLGLAVDFERQTVYVALECLSPLAIIHELAHCFATDIPPEYAAENAFPRWEAAFAKRVGLYEQWLAYILHAYRPDVVHAILDARMREEDNVD